MVAELPKIDEGDKETPEMNIAKMMADLALALPKGAIRQVCLTLNEDNTWEVLAGGHPAVHIGESGGDFSSEGKTPEEAISACLQAIKGT